ncbi:hypothetical protein [Mesorhizobium sp. J428]|uniref:hypothetical protein n=1 Tax=Mesorhizobium sp. J428 TaxID=2898440 RepID=UPI0021514A20|nr:hypothetical protein [Mesorhizobium sp. J428]MCR5856793.1 hypothetical protein [Mesorhizobium sp. J428]
MADRKDNPEAESRRILDRVAKESSADGASFVGRGVDRLKGHLHADDVDQADSIEVWGTRVGRAIGFLITLAILGWLLFYILGG